MDLDPRVAAIAAGGALIGSERVRRLIGRGFGYVAAGALRVGSPVVDAGRQVVDEARMVAREQGDGARRTIPRGRATAGRAG